MTNDIALRSLRRRLETVQLPVPPTQVMDEIMRWIEDSRLFYTHARHADILDREIEEAIAGAATYGEDRAREDGYAAALADIALLRGEPDGPAVHDTKEASV